MTFRQIDHLQSFSPSLSRALICNGSLILVFISSNYKLSYYRVEFLITSKVKFVLFYFAFFSVCTTVNSVMLHFHQCRYFLTPVLKTIHFQFKENTGWVSIVWSKSLFPTSPSTLEVFFCIGVVHCPIVLHAAAIYFLFFFSFIVDY